MKTLSFIVALGLVGCSSKFDDKDNNPEGSGQDQSDDQNDDEPEEEEEEELAFTDEDGDGVSLEDGDCDDENEDVHPDADEICDDLDNDCDDVVDEGFEKETWWQDNDEDTYGNPTEEIETCIEDPEGYVDNNLDCDDDDPNVFPGNDELIGDEIDNDCDDDVDERFDVEPFETDADIGYPSAVAVDVAGQVHILFHDATEGQVVYTGVDTTGAWKDTVVVADEDIAGEYLDAEIDSSGNIHLAYTKDTEWGTRELSYRYRNPFGAWSDEYNVDGGGTTDISVGTYVDLAVDDDGTPSVAYLDEDFGLPRIADVFLTGLPALIVPADLNYTGAIFEGVSTGLYTSLAIDSTGIHHVGFYDEGAALGFSPEVQYSAFNYDFDEIAISESVDGPGVDTSMAVQTDDVPCMAFQALDTKDLRFGCKIDGSWQMETVDSTGATGGQPSLAINDSDEYFISYYRETTGDLMLATKRKDVAWEIIEVDTDGNVGKGSSLAIDAGGVLHMTYYDATQKTLRYAKGF